MLAAALHEASVWGRVNSRRCRSTDRHLRWAMCLRTASGGTLVRIAGIPLRTVTAKYLVRRRIPPIILLGVAVLLMTTRTPASGAATGLRVQGNRIVDSATGQPVQLRGV